MKTLQLDESVLGFSEAGTNGTRLDEAWTPRLLFP